MNQRIYGRHAGILTKTLTKLALHLSPHYKEHPVLPPAI